jgi:hypothetical protein
MASSTPSRTARAVEQRRSTMRSRSLLVTVLFLVSTALQGQQPQAGPTPFPTPPIVIYRVDLNPSGSAFAVNEPVQEGEFWVFRSIPDRTVEHVPKARVKKVSRWTRDFDKEVVWIVDADPVGSVLAADEPVKKGNTWVFHAWKGGSYMSVRAADLRTVTKLTGMEAFKAEEIALGVWQLHGDVHINEEALKSGPPPVAQQAVPAPGSPQPGNWNYQGVPGQTDAYAPASGTVARPGDVPRASTPPPSPR